MVGGIETDSEGEGAVNTFLCFFFRFLIVSTGRAEIASANCSGVNWCACGAALRQSQSPESAWRQAEWLMIVLSLLYSPALLALGLSSLSASRAMSDASSTISPNALGFPGGG